MAHIEVREAGATKVVAQSDTDKGGTFDLEVPAGSYVVTARVINGLPAQPTRMPVTVHAGSYDTLVIRFDTGIRRPSSDDGS